MQQTPTMTMSSPIPEALPSDSPLAGDVLTTENDRAINAHVESKVGSDAEKVSAAAAGFARFSRAVGDALWIMARSPGHRHLFLSDLEWLLLPSLTLGQFRLYRRQGLPFAFANWAFLSKETEDGLLDGARRLRPTDWKSGEDPWIVDLIAPFGGRDAIIKDLRVKVFSGRSVKVLRRNEKTGELHVEVLEPLSN